MGFLVIPTSPKVGKKKQLTRSNWPSLEAYSLVMNGGHLTMVMNGGHLTNFSKF